MSASQDWRSDTIKRLEEKMVALQENMKTINDECTDKIYIALDSGLEDEIEALFEQHTQTMESLQRKSDSMKHLILRYREEGRPEGISREGSTDPQSVGTSQRPRAASTAGRRSVRHNVALTQTQRISSTVQASVDAEHDYPFETRIVEGVMLVVACPIIVLHPEDGWVELHCEICHGNATGRPRAFLTGVRGFKNNMRQKHRDVFDVENPELFNTANELIITKEYVLQTYVRTTLSVRAIDGLVKDIKAGKEPVEIRVCTFDVLRDDQNSRHRTTTETLTTAGRLSVHRHPSPFSADETLQSAVAQDDQEHPFPPASDKDIKDLVIDKHPQYGYVELRCPECGANEMKPHPAIFPGPVKEATVWARCARVLSAAQLRQLEANDTRQSMSNVSRLPTVSALGNAGAPFIPTETYYDDDEDQLVIEDDPSDTVENQEEDEYSVGQPAGLLGRKRKLSSTAEHASPRKTSHPNPVFPTQPAMPLRLDDSASPIRRTSWRDAFEQPARKHSSSPDTADRSFFHPSTRLPVDFSRFCPCTLSGHICFANPPCTKAKICLKPDCSGIPKCLKFHSIAPTCSILAREGDCHCDNRIGHEFPQLRLNIFRFHNHRHDHR
ncbi:hypothetical protein EJ08DRAFT_699644 [Tothia fuscella]|uniref:Uncharacterized protein n=1 Tax=Tothia fuscella TaxID=1048955 RepID=A0A9P4NLQ9_9PEZI|nr:hypothetical protein EJ08DRAFT_699644 [Tothia fuscella]